MEKLINFLKKYKIIFAGIIVVLSALMLFLPYVRTRFAGSTIKYSFTDLTDPRISTSFNLVVVCFISTGIVFAVLCMIFRKRILYGFSVSLSFVTSALAITSYFLVPFGQSSPHIAFYLAILLLLISLFGFFLLLKTRKRKPPKASQQDEIDELKRRISELENKSN